MFAHPKVSGIPSFDQLNALWLRARKTSSASLRIEVGKKNSYELIVRCFKSRKEPSWSLYESYGDGSSFVSSITSSDLNHVTSFVEKFCLQQGIDNVRKFEPTRKPRRERAIVLKMRPQKTLKGRERLEDKESFAGNLETLRIESLLQSLAISRATGRLSLCNHEGFADVFYEEGEITNAASSESSGNAALLELLTWQTGLFKFAPDKKITTLNVSNKLDKLLLKGATLIDQSEFLTAHGVNRETTFEQLADRATLSQMIARVVQTADEAALTEKFYEQVSPKRELYRLIRSQLLTKSQWIPIVFNLLSANIIKVASPEPAWQEDEGIEFKEIASFESQLTGEIDNLFTRQAFLYLANREFQRLRHGGAPLSVFLITPDNSQVLRQNKAFCAEISARLKNARRAADVIGMLDDGSIACALFDTNKASAARFARRAINLLTFAPFTTAKSVKLNFGCASAPDDGTDIFAILKSAREAANSRLVRP